MRFSSFISLLGFLTLSGAAGLFAQQNTAPVPAPATPRAKVQTPAAAADKSPGVPSVAPQKTAPMNLKPTSAQVLKLLELMRVRDELQMTLDSMKQEMKGQAEQVLRDKVPNPSAAQLKSVNGILDDAFAELSVDDLIQDLVPVYQRHLTRDDVQALVTFYASPPGQKILRVQPAILRESMETAGTSQQKRMETMLAKVELRMQQLIDQDQPQSKAGPEKK